ncbi:MAG: hypothetical protein ACR2PT_12225 [Endozoicomonas sp.]
MVRKLFVTVTAILLTTTAALFLLVFLSVDSQPKVVKAGTNPNKAFSRAEVWIERIQQAFTRDQLSKLVLQPDDIEGLVSYAAQRAKMGGQSLVSVEGVATEFMDSSVFVKTSIKPLYLAGVYLNLEVSFSERNGLPHWDYLKIGKVKFPGALLSWCAGKLLLQLPEDKARVWTTVTGAVKGFTVFPDKIALVYRSDKELRDQLKSQAMNLMLGSKEERETLQLYLDVLYAAAAQEGGTQLYMSRLLRAMMGLARARSSEPGNSAAEENQRLLRAFAIQVSDSSVRTLLAPGMKPHPIDRPILLRGRADLTQHFMVSAALALTLDEETALGIGVSKERADSQAGGSGFSFSDLVADMAGIRFAAAATENEKKARWLQDFLLKNAGESAYMPTIDWLPAGLTASAYQDLVRHPLYPAMLDKIVKRLNALPVR